MSTLTLPRQRRFSLSVALAFLASFLPAIGPPRRPRSRLWAAIRGPRKFKFTRFGRCCCGGGCTCSTQICVENCSGTVLVGATVTVGSLAPVTTNAGGCASVCLDSLGGAGSYQVAVSDSGYYAYSNTLSLTCGGTKTVKLLPTSGNPSILFDVSGCNSLALPGATISIAGGTYVTNGSGQASVGVTDAGSYPYTVACPPRFISQSGSVTITACSSGSIVDITLLPASGYACLTGTGVCLYPWMTTLNLTDSAYGTTTITYDVGTGFWNGSITGASYPGGCGSCGASTTNIYYQFGNFGTFGYQCGLTEVSNETVSIFDLCPGTSPGTASSGDDSPTTATGPPLTSLTNVSACVGGALYPSGGVITVSE